MNHIKKTLLDILSGVRDKNILFNDIQKLLVALKFKCRVKGDHFIYSHNNVDELINIQPNGNKAKAYQVKQIRNIILKYSFGGSIDG